MTLCGYSPVIVSECIKGNTDPGVGFFGTHPSNNEHLQILQKRCLRSK